ncbi:MAG: amidase family protein [Bacteroidota bacterium]
MGKKARMIRQTLPFLCFLLLTLIGCKEEPKTVVTRAIEEPKPLWPEYNDSLEIVSNADHEKERMRFKLIQSKTLDRNKVFQPLFAEVNKMDSVTYQRLKPMILEKDIPTLQKHVDNGDFTYETLVRFYLYRIYKYELNPETCLHTIISLNPNVIQEARALDADKNRNHPIYGMPILLKDNIGTTEMPTTAGAIALAEHQTDDAFVVERLKSNGALILGKVNLSEWAYYFCGKCPVGYSAVGGQTLNPYGRKVFETGGSSSGSGTATAANYAVACVGTETSGSILSPSSQNSVVGLKPTIGLLSRSGIVPISSTLDTPGPMTKFVKDNAIVLHAMMGYDKEDDDSVLTSWGDQWFKLDSVPNIVTRRFGVFKDLIEQDSLYRAATEKLRSAGVQIVAFERPDIRLEGFRTMLNVDMKNDLPKYFMTQSKDSMELDLATVEDFVHFNKMDSLVRMPYGQRLFEGILSDTTSQETLNVLKKSLQTAGRQYFDDAMREHDLDGILSINNYHAGFAAVAKYPALTLPMGFRPTGEPVNMTCIAKQFQEEKLYGMGLGIEGILMARKPPELFMD